jgi:hypothetical protein
MNLTKDIMLAGALAAVIGVLPAVAQSAAPATSNGVPARDICFKYKNPDLSGSAYYGCYARSERVPATLKCYPDVGGTYQCFRSSARIAPRSIPNGYFCAQGDTAKDFTCRSSPPTPPPPPPPPTQGPIQPPKS